MAGDVKQLQADMRAAKEIYPESVVSASSFILEAWIQGDEYAVDAFYDTEGEPVVLNVFKRMFAHEADTSDRIYFTGKSVLQEALAQRLALQAGFFYWNQPRRGEWVEQHRRHDARDNARGRKEEGREQEANEAWCLSKKAGNMGLVHVPMRPPHGTGGRKRMDGLT